MKCINKHEDSYQTAGGPPSKSWSLPKVTPRAQQDKFTIKTEKRSSGIIWQCKNLKQSKIIFLSITLTILMLMLLNNHLTTSVVFIMFTNQVVDHRRVEPLLISANYNK
jgi:hypothetical protein